MYKWIPLEFPFSYDRIEILKVIKSVERTIKDNTWWVRATPKNINFLLSHGFEDIKTLQEAKKENDLEVAGRVQKVRTAIKEKLKTKLFPYQEKGVCFIERRNGNALISDSMGLGKTLQAIGYIAAHPEIRPVLIVCPATAKEVWHRQLWDHARLNGVVGHSNKLSWGSDNILVVNYDILDKNLEWLSDQKLKLIVMDESQKIKNSTAARTKAAIKLCKGSVQKIFLSGTPILSRPIDLFTTLKILSPDTFGNKMQFGIKYCGGKHNGFGWDFSGSSNAAELHEKLSEFMIRRKMEEVKHEISAQFPEQIPPIVIPLEINNRKEYLCAEKDFINWVEKNCGSDAAIRASHNEACVKVGALKRLAANGKLLQVKTWLDEYLDTDKKIVLFAEHHIVLDQLKLWFPKAVCVDGRMNQKQRQNSIDEFQNNPKCKIFLGQLDAAGTAITLTASDTVAFVELGWSPTQHDQASARCRRVGSTFDSIFTYYLIAQNTIEEKIIKLLDNKRIMIDEVVDGKDTEMTDLLTDILKQIKKDYL